MKKTLKVISLCVVVLLSLSVFFGCGKENGKNNGNTSGKQLVLEEIKDISDYKIIRPDKGDGAKNVLVELRAELKDKLGVDLKVGTDFDGSSAKEILIGNTNREESKTAAEGLRSSDFKICKINSKIVIVGGSDVGLEKAMEFVSMYLISTERSSFAVPAYDGYLGRANYIADKITIDGADISEFTIASATYGKLDDFSKKIMNEVIGVELDTSKSTSDENKHYIIVDDTGTIEDKFSISVEDGNIMIKGSYNSADYAVDYFCSTYLNNNGGKNVELQNGDKFEGSKGKKDIYTKDQLMTVLKDMYNDPDRFIVGQQAEQVGYLPNYSLDKFSEKAGELPGILGLDFGCYGMYIKNYSEQKWSQAICQIVEYVAQGGIVEISSHIDNPSDPTQQVRGFLGDVKSSSELNELFEALITEGTDLNKSFKESIARDGKFLQDLRDNGVPVVWRPLHEMNGNWFWYCVTQNGVTADSEYWANVWRYIYDYYTKELGLDNLIWVYSPNVSDNSWDTAGQSTMSTSYCYPGNEYCDMVGVDWYFESVSDTVPDGYADILDVTGYIGALTEFGPGDNLRADSEKGEVQENLFNSMDMNDFLEGIKSEGSKYAYVLAWAGQWSLPGLGQADEFMALEQTLGAKELKVIFDGMK